MSTETSNATEHIVRVGHETSVNDLGLCIASLYREGKRPVLRAIGPRPVNQAMKALAVANRHLASTGVQLAAYPGLVNETVENRDGEPHLWVIVILKLVEVRL